jgi:exocyst complex component 4
MSEKRLLQASVLLVRSLKIINKPEMAEIGAVSDLRSYLVGQETVKQKYLAFSTKKANNLVSRLFEIS